MSTVETQIAQVFADAGAQGFLYAREIGGHAEVSVGGDDQVVLASVLKIPVGVAYAREVVAGRLDETARTKVGARYRVGGIGTAGCADDVEMSWRDLALLMLTISDNAATDVVFHRVGQEAVDQVLADLGLGRTRILGCCEDLGKSILADLGADENADEEEVLMAATPEQIWKLAVLDPARTTSSTPREIARLLEAIWTDEAAEPAACERVRSIMAKQVWPHRLSSGFGDEVQVAAKTGTLPAVRNEAGVVSFPDGRRFAVAVFTRAESLAFRLPAVDASIGKAARLAVDHLIGATR
ncbi:beta-lactamase class A [Amycolatopsis xylanica]|uniref:Beta-lactamase class A n=1 Tax=Amycolatopsis xylanica TaxID=589385 RepID=A0A1H3H2U9_9PSEU|nr:serine hydrolase [Amycolatopsis xylanica]SDY09084.1 beta-lactamase class A [Amycolatopsis xylanica]